MSNRAASYSSLQFQIGDSMTITVESTYQDVLWGWTYHRVNESEGVGSISGSGDMYSDASQFICLTDELVTWDMIMINQTAPYDYWVEQWDITIPSGCTSIASHFLDYGAGVSLKGLTIPEGVISIGDEAFRGAGYADGTPSFTSSYITKNMDISEIVLPSTLEHIGYGAFAWRVNVTDITFNNINYELEDYSSQGTHDGIFWLQTNWGTDLDDDGYLITNVTGGIGVKAYDWEDLFNRHAIFDINAAWYCAYDGGILSVPLYSEGEIGVCILDVGTVLYNKLVDINDSSAGPIRVYDGTSIKAIKM